MRFAIEIAMVGILWASGSLAATPPDPAARRGVPPHLSFAEGEVSFWRDGAEDWTAAKRNTPIAQGDALYAAADANLEVQLGAEGFVRAGDDTEVSFDTVESDFLQLRVRGGHVALDFEHLHDGRRIEVDTPAAAFTVDTPGLYRVDVGPDRTRFTVRRGGPATATPTKGDAITIESGREVAFAGDPPAAGEVTAAADPDAWDGWNDGRSHQVAEAATGESAKHLPQGVAGAEDLDQNGSWHEEPRYGSVWVPNSVSPGWTPYGAGRWIYDPYYGWTWIDDAPWGWAPFHYGRWVTVGGAWAWAPGPVVVAPFYSPALVAFFGTPGFSVSVGFGPTVGWVPLGWGEPLIPWWGHVGFVGVPCWHGWGGPHIVNNVVIQHNTYVNVKNINYQNNNALVATHKGQFGHPGWQRVALDKHSALQPVGGRLHVQPARDSFAPGPGGGHRPPRSMEDRAVVATRPAGRLHPDGRREERNTQLVSAPPPRWERAPQRPVQLKDNGPSTASASPRNGRDRQGAGTERQPSGMAKHDTAPAPGWDRPREDHPRPRVSSEPGWGSSADASRRPARGSSREPGFGPPPPPRPTHRPPNHPDAGGQREGWAPQGGASNGPETLSSAGRPQHGQHGGTQGGHGHAQAAPGGQGGR